MIQIRRGCFETNSSSMHSIVVTKNDDHYPNEYYKDIYLTKNNELRFYSSDLIFGRSPFEVLDTFERKLAYAIASFCNSSDPEATAKYGAEFDRIAKKYIPDFEGFSFDEIHETIYLDKDGNEIPWTKLIWTRKKGTKENKHYYYDENDELIEAKKTDEEYVYNDYGDIDHQSAGLLQSFLAKEKITLEEFLTNKKYVVIIDGDEYYVFEEMINANLIDKANIVKRFS